MAKPSWAIRQAEAAAKAVVDKYVAVALQQAEDAAIITLGKKYGFGEKRGAAFRNAFREVIRGMASGCLRDGKDDAEITYTKASIDRDLQYILGNNFEPWEKRYPF